MPLKGLILKLSSADLQLYYLLHLSLFSFNLVKTYKQSISNAVFIINETNILKHGIYIYYYKYSKTNLRKREEKL